MSSDTSHTHISSATVPACLHGQRLDAAVRLFLPESGTRARRRLFETHTLLVNGRPRPKGHTVLEGDVIMLVPNGPSAGETAAGTGHGATPAVPGFDTLATQVRVIERTSAFAALFKPGGMHTACIAGSTQPALETLLSDMFPETGTAPMLVNRLDSLTSGMVLVAFGQDNADRFRALEDTAAVEKLYLAVVEGALHAPLCIRNALDTAKRITTKVLETDSDDPLRHTTVLPLGAVSLSAPDQAGTSAPAGEEVTAISGTLVLASIRKGARHQIRAHLAHAAHPIIGDPLYGTPLRGEPLYLHHYHVEFEAFSATCPPPDTWRDWESWKRRGLALPAL